MTKGAALTRVDTKVDTSRERLSLPIFLGYSVNKGHTTAPNSSEIKLSHGVPGRNWQMARQDCDNDRLADSHREFGRTN